MRAQASQSKLISPTSREPLIPYVMALDGQRSCDVGGRNPLLAKLLFGGEKLYGPVGVWTVIVCHILRRPAADRAGSEAVALEISALEERMVRETLVSLSMSGTGLHPTTRAPLGAAMLYCIESMFFDNPERNRMPEMLSAFELFYEALGLVGIDVSGARQRVKTLCWAARLIGECREGSLHKDALMNACNEVSLPFARVLLFENGDAFVLDTERMGAEATVEEKVRMAWLARAGFNPANETLGKVSFSGGGDVDMKLGSYYSSKENDECTDVTKVTVHPRTLRPILMVPGGEGGALRPWEAASAEAYGPVSKQVPLHKLILQYFQVYKEFPHVPDELIKFVARSTKVKHLVNMAAPVVVLPVNIFALAESVIAEVAVAFAQRRMDFGDDACLPERVCADIVAGERRVDRALLEKSST